jgi:putative transposase
MNQPIANYRNHRFPPEIIARAVWLYYRFPLSLRHIEEMLLERGIAVSYETIRRWGRKHGSDYARRMRRKPPSGSDAWHLDEVAVRINGKKCWLWRAVDQDGHVLDEIVQVRRNTKAARRLLIRLLKKQGLLPKRMVTDKLRSYGAAKRQVMPEFKSRNVHRTQALVGRKFENGLITMSYWQAPNK